MASPLPRFNNHDLERTKIQLEIDRLRRPWYRNLDFYKTLIPSLAAILTVLFAFFSGFLDKRKLELEIDKKQLIYDISTFTHTRDSLYDAYNEKVGELNQTVQELHSVELRLEDISWSLLAAKDSVRDARDQLSRLQASSTASRRSM
jgi:exonuclease VII small subunit